MTSTVIPHSLQTGEGKGFHLKGNIADVICAGFLDLATLFRLLLGVPGVLHLVLDVVEHAAAEEDVEHVEGQERQPT